MDRKRYKLPFQKARIPQWKCPTCEKSILRLIKDSFFYKETSQSANEHKHNFWNDDWGPDCIRYVYSCQLKCISSSCNETVVSLGTGHVDIGFEYDNEGSMSQEWCDYFRPKYFQPHLKPFTYPKDTPKEVVGEFEQSFKLFFCNPPSASNHIRIALENILTSLKIKRFEVKNGKRHFVTLQRRIEMLPNKHGNLKELFMAIKWLGNAGSHSHKEITIDDVMDAYEIMEAVLKELFESKKDTAKQLAKKNKQEKRAKR